MNCSLEKGHDGPCIEGEGGTCRKTAAKWFATEPEPIDPEPEDLDPEPETLTPAAVEPPPIISERVPAGTPPSDNPVWLPVPGEDLVIGVDAAEWPTIDEATLTRYYRQTIMPPRSRAEALEWARTTITNRDAA
jgi:hypothetical protein